MSPKKYWRIDPERVNLPRRLVGEGLLDGPDGLLHKVSPRHGVVMAAWDARSRLGRVSALGVIRSVARDRGSAEVTWRPCEVAFRPNPAGQRWWTQPVPFFAFAPAVVQRYMLEDLFAEHFPEFEALGFGAPAPGPGRSAPIGHSVGGFVYVIRSDYGFKIGKTVNMKDRSRLFGVKLPFPISIEHYAWFEDYTAAERMLHELFHDKRLEGEWFALDAADLNRIRSFGGKVVVEGL